MLRLTAIICALWALPAAGQDGLLGTWERSQDGIEQLTVFWENIDDPDEATIENATVLYDTLDGQSTRRWTFREDGTFRLNYVNVYDYSDVPDDEEWAELLAELLAEWPYDGTGASGTWHTAGDSLWIEFDALIVYEGDTEVRFSEISAADLIRKLLERLQQVFGGEIGDGEEIEIPEEELAAFEAFFEKTFPIFLNLYKEKMDFAGTYQLEGDSLFLTSLGPDGADRTRVYNRATGFTAVARISWGALKAGW